MKRITLPVAAIRQLLETGVAEVVTKVRRPRRMDGV